MYCAEDWDVRAGGKVDTHRVMGGGVVRLECFADTGGPDPHTCVEPAVEVIRTVHGAAPHCAFGQPVAAPGQRFRHDECEEVAALGCAEERVAVQHALQCCEDLIGGHGVCHRHHPATRIIRVETAYGPVVAVTVTQPESGIAGTAGLASVEE